MTRMTKLLRDGDELSLAALEKIIHCMQRVDRPIYMGHIACEIGYSLAQTQAMLDHLEERGRVRQLTDDEKRNRFDVRGHIYVLVKAS